MADRWTNNMPLFLMLVGLWFGLETPELFAGGLNQSNPRQSQSRRLVLATTTSTENSGLLGYLLPPFESRYQIQVNIIALGTGQALQLGRSGDADLLMVHAPSLEQEFVNQGYGIDVRTFMYNDFVILGPPDDPAEVRLSQSLEEAMRKIADSQVPFISRGDSSGTHAKELALWYQAGITLSPDTPPQGSWYQEIGQGMGTVITLSQDRRAYTLADRGTFLSYLGQIDLTIVFEGDENLYNPYSIILVNPERHPHVNWDLAKKLLDYVTSQEGKNRISSYEVNGNQLFFPLDQ